MVTSIAQPVVSSFQASVELMTSAFCCGATSRTWGGTGADTFLPLMVKTTTMSRSWMGALPSFTRKTFTV